MDKKVDTKTTKDDEEFVATGFNFLKNKMMEVIASKGKVVVGLSDDRYIEATHKDSNTRLVASSFTKCPSKHYHFVHPDTSLPLEKCIEEYEKEVKKLLANGPIDILTLGLGPDGQEEKRISLTRIDIASLFPPVSDAILNDTTHQVINTTTTQFAVFNRITITFPVITQAHTKVFFLKTAKKKVWDEMLASAYNPSRWPAHKVIESGNTTLVIC